MLYFVKNQMDLKAPKDVFLESVRRCIADDTFIASFYERFLESSEEVRLKFRFTDFDQQNKMLSRSLELCAGATSGERDALAEIQERGVSHDRNHLNIKPEMYDCWLNAIIHTARDVDNQWSDDVEKAWRRILGHVVHHMIREY